MLSSAIITLLSAGAIISAAAVPNPLAIRTLTEDDIILYSNDGRIEIMNKTSYALLSSISSPKFNLTSGTPSPLNATNMTEALRHNNNHTQSKRTINPRCSTEKIFTMNPVSTFLNWDIAMSTVVAAGTESAVVAVTSGYTISNSISVGVSADLTIVKDFLSTSYSIDYTQSWESSYSTYLQFTVPAGKWGAVVSNPLTTRHSGVVSVGCIGFATDTAFQADSYSSKSYSGMAWVDGTISLCTGDSYPLKRCIGSGTL